MDNDIQEAGTRLRNIVQEVASSRLKTICCRDDFTVRNIPSSEIPKSEKWLVLIMIYAEALKIQFKVHFSEKNMKPFMERNNDLKDHYDNPDICLDYIKEFCNMVAGGVKQSIEGIEKRGGLRVPEIYRISLPEEFSKAGSNSAFIKVSKETPSFEDCFEYKIDNSHIRISSIIYTNSLERLIGVTKTEHSDLIVTDGGEIEFL
ncbi:MAG: hypothetical protein HQK54_01505 [Oligoflexales bacterium]|nr:hypothetical protein [Oligoflexales bacterium]